MRPEFSQHTIAWFKFADLVARKEKERAMSIFRLMSLSWHDEGYSYLLKGDLLRAFNDDSAYEAYRKAVYYYDETSRPAQAAAACERMVELDSSNSDLLRELIVRYARLRNIPYVKRYGIRLKELMGTDSSSDGHDAIAALLYEHVPEATEMIAAMQ